MLLSILLQEIKVSEIWYCHSLCNLAMAKDHKKYASWKKSPTFNKEITHLLCFTLHIEYSTGMMSFFSDYIHHGKILSICFV